MHRMGRNVKDQHTERLFQAILSLKDTDECFAFFKDLCTTTELIAMKQRFWVADLLQQGYVYSDIVTMTGASTATISRVNRCLQDENGGYVMCLDRVKAEEK